MKNLYLYLYIHVNHKNTSRGSTTPGAKLQVNSLFNKIGFCASSVISKFKIIHTNLNQSFIIFSSNSNVYILVEICMFVFLNVIKNF